MYHCQSLPSCPTDESGVVNQAAPFGDRLDCPHGIPAARNTLHEEQGTTVTAEAIIVASGGIAPVGTTPATGTGFGSLPSW
jgi:hypothetical protein